MPKYKFTIFDVDVGCNVHEEITSSGRLAADLAESVIDSYECEKDFADKREIEENVAWSPQIFKQRLTFTVLSTFFDSISIWLPGHHRKITIAKIEENN